MKNIVGLTACVVLTATASGDILWFDIGAEGWDPFLNAVGGYGYVEASHADWSGLADFGISPGQAADVADLDGLLLTTS